MNDRRSEDLIENALFSTSVFKAGGETTLNQAYVPEELRFREDAIRRITQNFRPLFLASKDGIRGFSTNRFHFIFESI